MKSFINDWLLFFKGKREIPEWLAFFIFVPLGFVYLFVYIEGLLRIHEKTQGNPFLYIPLSVLFVSIPCILFWYFCLGGRSRN
tara:strand:+ start:722 stop:970 length:249 start_codon:yes stop_codon:yes gene_type:complete